MELGVIIGNKGWEKCKEAQALKLKVGILSSNVTQAQTIRDHFWSWVTFSYKQGRLKWAFQNSHIKAFINLKTLEASGGMWLRKLGLEMVTVSDHIQGRPVIFSCGTASYPFGRLHECRLRLLKLQFLRSVSMLRKTDRSKIFGSKSRKSVLSQILFSFHFPFSSWKITISLSFWQHFVSFLLKHDVLCIQCFVVILYSFLCCWLALS